MEKKTFNKILDSVWHYSWFYLIVVMAVLVWDNNTHPDKYNIVDNRLERDESNISLLVQGQGLTTINPEFYYTASTMQECKPAVNIINFTKKWVDPFLTWMIVLIITKFLVSGKIEKMYYKYFKDDMEDEKHEK